MKILAGRAYDLEYDALLGGHVCVTEELCAEALSPASALQGIDISMSGPAVPGERWEIVPLVAERGYARTDNGWDRLGEVRSQGIERVVLGAGRGALRRRRPRRATGRRRRSGS
jgi:hypothetical protein